MPLSEQVWLSDARAGIVHRPSTIETVRVSCYGDLPYNLVKQDQWEAYPFANAHDMRCIWSTRLSPTRYGIPDNFENSSNVGAWNWADP